jgi:hypothetical protein
MYHCFYTLFTSKHLTATMGIGGISQDPNYPYYEHGWQWADAALTAYETMYTETMPIEIWNFHYYNLTPYDYDPDSVKPGIDAWIDWIQTTRGGIYSDKPIWLTEWGKLNGWANPELLNNQTPDDTLHAQLTPLMLDWAAWMETEGEIDRWFWFVTTMGDWNRNMEFDSTGWLFRESKDVVIGTIDSGTQTSLTDAALSPPQHGDPPTWVGASLYMTNCLSTKRVVQYNSISHTLVFTPPCQFNASGDYRLF